MPEEIHRIHIGAYGIILKDDRIPLVKKSRGPYAGLMALPGGKIEWGEQPEDTLKRELVEELGLEPIRFEHVTDRIHYTHYEDKGTPIAFQHVAHLYRVSKTKKVRGPATNHEDVAYVEWIDPKTVDLSTLTPMAQFVVKRIMGDGRSSSARTEEVVE